MTLSAQDALSRFKLNEERFQAFVNDLGVYLTDGEVSVPTLRSFIEDLYSQLVEGGLLGATPFATYALMIASSLPNDSYAVVTKDSDLTKCGYYQKDAGTWQFLPWNPVAQALQLVNAEATTRANADAVLQGNINAESSTRSAADLNLQDQIEDEETARQAADADLQGQIDDVVTDYQSADATLQTNLNSESSTRSAADLNLQSQVEDEEEARQTADADLQSQIDSEETARSAKDLELETNLAAEVSIRQLAVDAINEKLRAVFSSVRFNNFHDDNGNRFLFAVVGANQKIGFGVTSKLKIMWGGNSLVLDRVVGIKDSKGVYAVVVTPSGKVHIPKLAMPSSISSAISALSDSLSSEVSSRISGDNNLQAGLNTEIADRTTAVNNATSLVNSLSSTINSTFRFAKNIHDDYGRKYILAFVSATQFGMGITKNMELVIKDAVIRRSRLPLNIRDRTGTSALVVTNGGKVYAPNLVMGSKQLAQFPNRTLMVINLNDLMKYGVMHVVGDGQSLSIGVNTSSAISTTQPYSNITFSSGPTKSIGDSGYTGTNFVPLVESNSVESPTSGALNGFVRRIVEVGGTASEYPMLGTQAGVGGQRIQTLTDEALYVRLRQQIVDAKATADAQGKSYAVVAITWIQGEADISGTLWTRAIDYYQRYTALMTKIRETAVTVSNQNFLPPVFSYQVGAHMYYNKRYLGIAIAQWRASVENQDIVLATPCYRLPHSADNLHLSAEGSWLLGEYLGRAMFWTMVKGQKWRPLEPVSVYWTSTYIDVVYNVPCKPIQISDVVCTSTTNSGFDIWNNGSVYDSGATSNDDQLISDAIQSVSVVSDDTIRITLNPSATIPLGAVLSYGRGRPGDSQTSGPVTGARGNVVDSHGLHEVVTSPIGNTHAMYNVSVLFEYSRKNGFF